MLISRNLQLLGTCALSLDLMQCGFVILLGVGLRLTGVTLAAALRCNGHRIKTIARRTPLLALFLSKSYGARLGRISCARMGVNASAPFIFAWLTQRFGGSWSFATMAMCFSTATLTHPLFPDPRRL